MNNQRSHVFEVTGLGSINLTESEESLQTLLASNNHGTGSQNGTKILIEDAGMFDSLLEFLTLCQAEDFLHQCFRQLFFGKENGSTLVRYWNRLRQAGGFTAEGSKTLPLCLTLMAAPWWTYCDSKGGSVDSEFSIIVENPKALITIKLSNHSGIEVHCVTDDVGTQFISCLQYILKNPREPWSFRENFTQFMDTNVNSLLVEKSVE